MIVIVDNVHNDESDDNYDNSYDINNYAIIYVFYSSGGTHDSLHLVLYLGWSCAFEISIRAFLQNFKIGEMPLKSVDRLFGGASTFKAGSWIVEYLKLYLWGFFAIYKKKIKKS